MMVARTGCIGKCRETVAADDCIYFRLCSVLHFWEGNLSKHPPRTGGSSRLSTYAAANTLSRRMFG